MTSRADSFAKRLCPPREPPPMPAGKSAAIDEAATWTLATSGRIDGPVGNCGSGGARLLRHFSSSKS